MIYNIQPVLAAIGQTQESNQLSVVIGNDTGTTCQFKWQLLVSGQRDIMGSGSFSITGEEYTTYSAEQSSTARLNYASTYIASHLVPVLTIINS